ncbi:MAG: acetyl-CoA hydrolase [Xanthobacteraceae bacterium]|nr:acetyl-CoA hydrolase [Xanthobacteraceae bacterium]
MTEPVSFTDPERIAEAIIGRVGKNIVLGLPLGIGKANHVANALYARAVGDPSIKLRIFTALTLEKPHPRQDLERRFMAPISERLFAGYPELEYGLAQRAGRLPPNIEVNEFFFLAGSRLHSPSAQQSYISANYTHALRYALDHGVNVFAQLVATRSGDAERRFSLSSNTDLGVELLQLRRAGAVDILMVAQTNSEMPFMPGDADVGSEAFDFVLDSPSTDFPLFAPPREPVDLTEYAAGLHAALLVPDGGTLQLGIGALGDAVAQALVLRHSHNAAFKQIVAPHLGRVPSFAREQAPFATGLYGCSEMFVEGFLDLIRAGVIRREVDGALLHAGFFLGSRAFYRALREMPANELDKLQMKAIGFVNEPYEQEERKRRARVKARFINTGMMTTLLGAMVSDTLADGKVVSGVGGQYNFVAQAFALPDARSIIMQRATRTVAGRTVSNIVWEYPEITIPRHLRDVVVTEYGIADLRGKSDRDTIVAMLSVADARFQDTLLQQAKKAGKVEAGFVIPPEWRANTPEQIVKMLRPARAAGHLPQFPFGTDFTSAEQQLMPALQRLRAASRFDLAAMALGGLRAKPDADALACLKRMDLAQPRRIADHITALVLRGALAQTLHS